MKLRNLLLMVMALALMVGTSACIFSPDDNGGGGTPGPTGLPPATNPDILLDNFERIYTEMRIDDFRNMLHPEYKTVLLPSTLAEWEQGGNPLAAAVFYRDDEINIHENMFSGNTGLGALGETIPPIDSIQVDYLNKSGSWEPIPETDEYFAGFGGYWALFNVLLYFNNPDQHRYEVRQDVEFYVVPTTVNGNTIWVLLGQRGLEPTL